MQSCILHLLEAYFICILAPRFHLLDSTMTAKRDSCPTFRLESENLQCPKFLEELISLERSTFKKNDSWADGEMEQMSKKRNCIVMVARLERDGKVGRWARPRRCAADVADRQPSKSERAGVALKPRLCRAALRIRPLHEYGFERPCFKDCRPDRLSSARYREEPYAGNCQAHQRGMVTPDMIG